ncbi:hypothetical protein CFC21_009922 [Triticum aestivum]|uniref:NB-ARC domain-containing protein n=2 Tax=Triticum aestivum TaxID=4565 RepID=A0A9R1IU87_WHEAT|nr:disease resistance protein RGA4-like [Triticum aestivum]KAF6992972.1 hypothetical protein CFC21_009922 [Triticum aestivum]
MVSPAGLVAEKAAATAFANVVMGRLNRELDKKYQMWKNIRTEISSLQTDLGILAAAVDDHQTMAAAPRTAVARVYGEEIRELTHDIEDCVERFLHRITCKPGASRARRSAHAIRTFRTRLRFAAKIKEFRSRVAEARERALKVAMLADGAQQSNIIDTVGYAQDCCHPVGIEWATMELRRLLDIEPNQDEAEGTSNNTPAAAQAQLRVVAIVGFGGSGKTTLAKAVYDNVHREGSLRCAWVDGHSLDHKDANGIIQHIQEKLHLGEGCSATLPTEQHQDRYFIVVDDMKDKHLMQWNSLRNAFRDNGRIIVTTDTQSLANRCCNHPREEDKCTFGYVYNMKSLGEEDSRKIALLGRCTPELVLGAAKLLKKCGGLPLALYSVACQLSCENVLTGKFCNKLCNELGTYLEREDDEPNFARLRGVLRENYTSLSDYTVRTCLLYLGIFPVDRPFKKNVMIRRWLAEGYARHHQGRHQTAANENFKTLINRSIILPVAPISNAIGKTCKAHGIMHAFTLHKSMSKKFIMPFGAQQKKVRHFFIHDSDVINSRTMPDIDLSRVRSLTVIGNACDAISNFSQYKLTRVLDMEGCIDVRDCHLKDICKLWNLRYLSLGPNITMIPKEIAQLKLLETLDASKARVNVLPVEAIELPCLIHLIGKFKLQDPVKTERLPKECMLETVAGFVADKGRGFLLLMDHMKKLNKVKIWCECEETEQDQAGMNGNLSKAIQKYIETPMGEDNVRSLSLYFQGLPQGSLSALDQICQHYSLRAGHVCHLSSLKLHGNSNPAILPKFVALFRDLTKLSISTTVSVTRYLLSVLGEMPVLLYLKLAANSVDGLVIQHGKFRSLHCLCLELKLVGTSVLTIEDGARSEIISLQLICKNLVGLSNIEITHLRELKEIALHPDVAEETRKAWEAEARNHHNRPNVLSIAGDHEEEPAHEYHIREEHPAAKNETPATCSALALEVDPESNATSPVKPGLVVDFAKGAESAPASWHAAQLQTVPTSATC